MMVLLKMGKPAFDMITILGPTASGKTKIAAMLSQKINGEIISADSRQVYKGMNIGTGKDYHDYIVENKKIPCHLIDIVEPGTEYNVFKYQQEFISVYNDVVFRKSIPVLCGGTGMYLEAILKGYRLIDVPPNLILRKELKEKSLDELINILSGLRQLHNTTDTLDVERIVRAIEIESFYGDNKKAVNDFPEINTLIIGVNMEREYIRKRITHRLEKRLQEGMIEEVKGLLAMGISPQQLKFYGLEYKYLTMYILGELKYQEMFSQLNTAIHQFAKRQMTWFRRMEKRGFNIQWIDGTLAAEKIFEQIHGLFRSGIENLKQPNSP